MRSEHQRDLLPQLLADLAEALVRANLGITVINRGDQDLLLMRHRIDTVARVRIWVEQERDGQWWVQVLPQRVDIDGTMFSDRQRAARLGEWARVPIEEAIPAVSLWLSASVSWDEPAPTRCAPVEGSDDGR